MLERECCSFDIQQRKQETMARPRKKKSEIEHLLIQEEPKTDWEKWLAHLEENYKLYVAGVVFLILCVAIGALIRGAAVIR